MINYIRTNKQWIFSGIGVLIISLVISSAVYLLRTGSQSYLSSKSSTGLKSETSSGANPSSPTMSEPNPIQIMQDIDKLPTLQRSDAARNYEGIKVDWELEFHNALKDEYWSKKKNEDLVDLSLKVPGDGLFPRVECAYVKLSQYKELRIMTEGRRIRVTGNIAKIDPNGGTIYLKDYNLIY